LYLVYRDCSLVVAGEAALVAWDPEPEGTFGWLRGGMWTTARGGKGQCDRQGGVRAERGFRQRSEAVSESSV
jgi:hypothetical protein